MKPVKLGRIVVFPIKSLDGVERSSVRITEGGILEGDRVHAIFDSEGRVVNGKRTARVHELRAKFDESLSHVTVWEEGTEERANFELADAPPFEHWLSDFFGFAVTLRHDPAKGFPDDTIASGPTFTSEASLAQVAKWFTGITIESARRRFRTNLEFVDCVPFIEDMVFNRTDKPNPFQIGNATLLAHNPCQRCAVPARDPRTGEAIPKFQKLFSSLREAELPQWAARERFNHFYRFAVNTSIPASEAGKILSLGDVLQACRPA